MTLPELLVQPYFKLLPFDMASLLSAIVWGEKNFLTPEQYQVFQKTGLLHLLVLSGQNITLLLGFIAGINPLLGKKGKIITTVIVALFYLLAFPNQAPIIRACIMAIISSTALFIEHHTKSVIVLCITGALMLIWQPSWVTSLSFWLSMTATAGIVTLYPWLKRKYKNILPDSFALSISAQVFTTPLLLIAFREVSLLSLPMNILVAWLIEPLMVLGLLLSILGTVSITVGNLVAFVLFGMLHLLNAAVQTGYYFTKYLIIRI